MACETTRHVIGSRLHWVAKSSKRGNTNTAVPLQTERDLFINVRQDEVGAGRASKARTLALSQSNRFVSKSLRVP